MSNIIIEYSKVYINYYNILNILKGNGNKVNRSTAVALKYVLVLPVDGEGYFSWKDYKNFTPDDFSKVQYLNLLNELTYLKVLKAKEKKNTKLFILNKSKWDLI